MQPNEAVQRLQLLSLAVQDAVRLDHWSDVNTLMAERESIICQLEQAKQQFTAGQLEELINLDRQTMTLMTISQAKVLEEARGNNKVSKARKAYAQPTPVDMGQVR